LYRDEDLQNGMESRRAGKALNAEEIGYVVALIMGWTGWANKWESTENAGFSHVINKKLESIFLNKFKMRSKLRFSI
jgi:hypothetical protein